MCDDRLPLPRMQRCLCTELKTGCLIWGWTQLVLAILGISTLRSYSDNAYHHSIVYPTLGVGIVLSILLLVGLHSHTALLVQIYYFVFLFFVLLCVISFVLFVIDRDVIASMSVVVTGAYNFIVVVYTRSCFYTMYY
ncbi:uncharacterized protein LOC119692733 isoform X2 [Plutella xylostella]|uniref:uncharacterized protein LOC119692733 isoform X2 n=1 Tax=Plutella xylostella TaxID=51655 RepID=UPI002032BB54|nr:uncharacterized protein LOC119692733 isoform X2 [Plutella xylostella]